MFLVLISVAITYLYYYFSGAESEYSPLILVIVIVGTTVLYVTYTVGKFNHSLYTNNQKKYLQTRYCGGLIFWILATGFGLPLILNSLSFLLKKMGFDVIGNYIFECRFLAMIWFALIVTSLYLLGIFLKYLYRRFKKKLNFRILTNR